MIGFEQHDHQSCIASTVAEADRYCQANSLRLTPTRRRVLEILLERHAAMGAYDILDQLRADGQSAQPPVAYRALDFLVQHGFAHKIERLNAFVACSHVGQAHTPAFLICRNCNKIAETQTPLDQGVLVQAANDAGFRIERMIIEAMGLCPDCEDQAAWN